MFLPVIVLLHTPENIIVLLTIFGFLYGVPYGVNATYMTESFETHDQGHRRRGRLQHRTRWCGDRAGVDRRHRHRILHRGSA